MTAEKTLVLDAVQVKKKIRRMAFEIYENHFSEKEIIIAGIDGQGYELAKLIKKEIDQISDLNTNLVKVSLNKTAPQQGEINTDKESSVFKKKSVILVDDVSNTGRTLAYALKPFLSVEVKRIEAAVLVNRSHTAFPVQVKYTGYELATTLKEHVQVVLGKEMSVYLL
ncbi:MAG TPA: phosphoribosyltransferase family protein [Cyclobacteriaceae bacterium]|nr:phosphoribosyltransferase family protein [Cyclobacteriaceae bacterium]